MPKNSKPSLSSGLLGLHKKEYLLYALLLALPSLLLAGPLLRGAIPWFMDTVMYFYPLRVHAARLVAGGEWPLWNRCIMAGVPLLENPQSALAYPLHWPFFIWPGGFWFTFPMTLQLGLCAALTAWALRRAGAGRAGALWAGAVVLAGGYGWSRLQFGNYMNVLPWWPLWLGAGLAFAHDGRRRWLVAGAGAVAMMLLAGAHQLAAYGLAGLAAVAAVQMTRRGRSGRRWLGFTLATFVAGALLGAWGWAPSLAFLAQTGRSEGLEAGQVMVGAIRSARELVTALAGDWTHWRLGPGKLWADAESTAWIGPVALMLAAVAPARRRLWRLWLGCWLAAVGGMALSCAAIVEPLARLTPLTMIFHDPRRWLGMSQWMLTLASALGLVSIWELKRAAGLLGSARWRFLVRRLWPALALGVGLLAMEGAGVLDGRLLTLWAFLCVWVLGAFFFTHRPVGRWACWAALTASLLALGHLTFTRTDLTLQPAAPLTQTPPLLARANLQPGERFFTLDWQRSISYDYLRPALTDWALPNLAMLWGYEDLGGYEPAQSRRYRAFIEQTHAAMPWRRLYPQHFGMIQNPLDRDLLNQGNVRAAVMPRWGVPLFAQAAGPQAWVAYGLPGLAPPWSIRALTVETKQGQTGPPLELDALNQQGRVQETFKPSGPHAAGEGDDLVCPGAAPIPPGAQTPPISNPRLGMFALDDQSGPLPTVLGCRLPEQGRVVDLFVWGEPLRKLWQPVALGEMTALMRYQGPSAWTHWEQGSGAVTCTMLRSNRLELDIQAQAGPAGEPPRLIVHDAFWPGWRAFVDGQSTTLKASGLWRALDVPAGRHRILMVYRPASFGVTWLMFVLGAGLVLWLGWRQRRKVA